MTFSLAKLSPDIQNLVAETKTVVAALNKELPENGLVVWSAGNVSQRIPQTELFVIKPSGIRYKNLTSRKMVVCTLDGQKVNDEGCNLSPSSDTATHAYIYRHMPEVGGVVHTHSTYAVAWAACGKEIPCVLTMMADEYGGAIPVGPFAIIGDDSIGRGVVQTLKNSRCQAVLMQNHGPFTVGYDGADALKAAVMVEEVAKAVYLADRIGSPIAIPSEIIDRLFERYQNAYGQK